MLRSRLSLLALSLVAALFFAGSASAADSIWWSSFNAGLFSHATLTGGSGSNLLPGPLHPSGPMGSVVDPASGIIYWANFNNDTIGYSNLEGAISSTLNTGTATVSGPSGVAIDVEAGKLFWTNYTGNKISWAYLDGSGGADLDTGPATVDGPRGITVRPVSNSVFWTNYTGDKISWAAFEGGVGGDIPVPPADVDGPEGIAVNPSSNLIYWANHDGGSIGYSEFAGPVAGILPISGVTIVHPTGVAIDPEAGLLNPLEAARIYWADEGAGGIFSAPIEGGAAERIDTGAANAGEPAYPFLFQAPKVVPPQMIFYHLPEAKVGEFLSCGKRFWKPDLPEASLFRAPATFGYSWTYEGAPVAGARSEVLLATGEGIYACNVLAANSAGATEAPGAAWRVRGREEPLPAPQMKILRLKRSRSAGTVQILLKVSGPGTVTLSGKKVVRRTIRSSGAGVVKVPVAAKGKARRKLLRTGTVKVSARLRFDTTEGAQTSITRTITLSRRG
jgi:low density lipoprotein receptor-related protein 5/6